MPLMYRDKAGNKLFINFKKKQIYGRNRQNKLVDRRGVSSLVRKWQRKNR